jgi:hypothetical protein
MNKISKFWKKNDQKILVVSAILLVSVVSFRAGETYKGKQEAAEIKISLVDTRVAGNPKEAEVKVLNEAMERNPVGATATGGAVQEGSNESENVTGEQKDCAFVGSKNSDKYHLLGCRYAVKIKESNRVCFSSMGDAQVKGYQAGKCCVK